MQTPQGYEIIDGRVIPVDWLQVIFNPSFPYRWLHMSVAAFLATALFVGAAGAWHLLQEAQRCRRCARMLSMAMWMVLIVAPIQAVIGDFHGLNTLQHQPAKIAALEGHWENTPGEAGTPLVLFGLPDMAQEKNHYAIEIPRLGGLILTHEWDGQIKGLKEFAPEDRPNASIIFWTFRIMVGLGLLMISLGLWSWLLRRRDAIYRTPLFLRAALCMGPAGLLAILAGWYTTEIGRQPWVVYGLMRTKDAVSAHGAGPLALTLGLFIIVYLFVFGVGIAYILRLVRKGPMPYRERQVEPGGPGQDRQQMRPLSAVEPEDSTPGNSEHSDYHNGRSQ